MSANCSTGLFPPSRLHQSAKALREQEAVAMAQIHTLWRAVEDKRRENGVLRKTLEMEERIQALERALEVQVSPHEPGNTLVHHSVLPPSLPLSFPPSLLPPPALYELHGNGNVEKCKKCGRDYLRDFSVRTSFGVFMHNTGQWVWSQVDTSPVYTKPTVAVGRTCDDPKCGGELIDTIINFGENLPTGEGKGGEGRGGEGEGRGGGRGGEGGREGLRCSTSYPRLLNQECGCVPSPITIK